MPDKITEKLAMKHNFLGKNAGKRQKRSTEGSVCPHMGALSQKRIK